MVDMPGDANDCVVTSQSADHLHPTATNEQLVHTPTSPKTPPMKSYGPPMPPKLTQLPATPIYWCDPVTMTLEQIEEYT